MVARNHVTYSIDFIGPRLTPNSVEHKRRQIEQNTMNAEHQHSTAVKGNLADLVPVNDDSRMHAEDRINVNKQNSSFISMGYRDNLNSS